MIIKYDFILFLFNISSKWYRHQNDRSSTPHWPHHLSLLPQFSPTVIGWLLCVSLQCHPSMSINPRYIICPPIDNLPYPPPNVQGWLLCYYYRANLTLTADTATDVDSCLHCCSCHHCRGCILIDISLPISSGGETWERWFLSFYRSYKHQSKMAVLRRLMR